MTADKTIRRVNDPELQETESFRYWQGLSIGDRLTAVWEASAAAYAFAAAFKETPADDAQRPKRTLTRVQYPRR
jgi:hypothetical protein